MHVAVGGHHHDFDVAHGDGACGGIPRLELFQPDGEVVRFGVGAVSTVVEVEYLSDAAGVKDGALFAA